MLELYQAEGCPHSRRVRETMTDLGLSYVVHNPRLPDGTVQNPGTRRALERVGGEDQIPLLLDTSQDATVYEAAAIISHLEAHYG